MTQTKQTSTVSATSNPGAPRRLTLTRATLRNIRGGDGYTLAVATKSTPMLTR